MIIFSENFDQVKEVDDLEELLGYEGFGSEGSAPQISDSDAFLNVDTSTPLKLGDQHKRSLYSFERFTTSYFVTPSLRDSRLMVFGICVGSSGMRDGLNEVIGSQNFLRWTQMDVFFTNAVGGEYDESSVLFKVSFLYRDNGSMDILFDNMDESLTQISPESGIPLNRYRKNFIEIYTDSTGAESGHGTVKVAINGITVVTRENVVNSNYLDWEGNPSNPLSFYKRVAVNFKFHTVDYKYSYQWNDQQWLIDSLYICNEEGGVHDDFLGPIHITTMYPDPEQTGDVNNWVGFKDREKIQDTEEFPNASLIDDPALDFSEEADDYIEADVELLQELYYMKNNIPHGRTGLNNPIAVNFRTFVKHIFSYESEEFDKGLIALTKPSGNAIDRETGAKVAVDQYTYKPLDLYYGVVPNLAVPWTWELLDGTQFGFESTQLIHQLFLDEFIDLSESVTEE